MFNGLKISICIYIWIGYQISISAIKLKNFQKWNALFSVRFSKIFIKCQNLKVLSKTTLTIFWKISKCVKVSIISHPIQKIWKTVDPASQPRNFPLFTSSANIDMMIMQPFSKLISSTQRYRDMDGPLLWL